MRCENCYHKKICIDGVNHKYAEKCRQFKDEDLVVELPCKVGDVVYTNMSMQGWYFRAKDRPYEGTIVYVGINGETDHFNIVLKNGNMLTFKFSDIGKTVFLTREEAEKALKEREANA